MFCLICKNEYTNHKEFCNASISNQHIPQLRDKEMGQEDKRQYEEHYKVGGTADVTLNTPNNHNITVQKLISRNEYFDCFKLIIDEMFKTSKTKNTDYAQAKNAFANFSLIEIQTNGRISTADGILTRMCDKQSRLGNLIGKASGSVATESIIDTVHDLAVYSVILEIFLKHYPSGFLYNWK